MGRGEDDAYEAYIKANPIGYNPLVDSRDGHTPIGLKVGRYRIFLAHCDSH